MATWSVWDYAPTAFSSFFAAASEPTPAPARRPALLLLGDSITERGTDVEGCGWVALLQSRYNRSVDIDCRGLSGYNTKYVIALLLLERPLILSVDVRHALSLSLIRATNPTRSL